MPRSTKRVPRKSVPHKAPVAHSVPHKAPVAHSSTVPTVVAPTSSMMTTIKEGFGFGVGSAVAHRVVGGLFGPGSQSPSQSPSPSPSQSQIQVQPIRNHEYEQCLAEHSNITDGISYCSYLLTEAKDKGGLNK